jgi:hypothetical protein
MFMAALIAAIVSLASAFFAMSSAGVLSILCWAIASLALGYVLYIVCTQLLYTTIKYLLRDYF